MPLTSEIESRPQARKSAEVTMVANALESLCASLQPGDVVPSHKELMRRFDASERSVLRALDEMRRKGKIIRRPGAGTFVAERVAETGASNGHGAHASGVPASASALVNSHTVIAIAKPDSSFFDHAMRLLFGHVENAGLSLACRFLDPATSTLALPKEQENAVKPRGYILFRHDLLPLAKQLQDAGNRVVLVGVPYADAAVGVANVYSDHYKGGALATQHLIELGHRRIAYYGINDFLQKSRRWQGHERALADARRSGLEVTLSVLHPEEADRWKHAPETAREYFARADAPTALMYWSDNDAVEMVSTLSRAGLRVPHDVSIIGYDDLPAARRSHPSLTTVNSAIEQQLQAALDILTDDSPGMSTHTIVVLPTLVKRESCAPPSR